MNREKGQPEGSKPPVTQRTQGVPDYADLADTARRALPVPQPGWQPQSSGTQPPIGRTPKSSDEIHWRPSAAEQITAPTPATTSAGSSGGSGGKDKTLVGHNGEDEKGEGKGRHRKKGTTIKARAITIANRMGIRISTQADTAHPDATNMLQITDETASRIDGYKRRGERREDVLHRGFDALENNQQHRREMLRHYLGVAALLLAAVGASIGIANSDAPAQHHAPKPASTSTTHPDSNTSHKNTDTSIKSERRDRDQKSDK